MEFTEPLPTVLLRLAVVWGMAGSRPIAVIWPIGVRPVSAAFGVILGIPYTEAQALRTRGDDYAEYQRTTSPFIPLPPKP